jgi:quercetin dioxygenase-like cupin family protein
MITPQQTPKRRIALALTLSLGLLAVGCSSGSDSTNAGASSTTTAATSSAKPQVSTVLDKQAQTVLDQLLQYPTGSQAQVSSAILTIAPGVSTGLHKHDAPMYAYILEGTLTVTYEGGIVKEFSAGSAILEAVGTPHNGENKTDKPVKILVVNMGAEGVANSVTL